MKKRDDAKLRDDADRFVGNPPYDDPTNFSYGDGYFAVAKAREHGQQEWVEAVQEARRRKKQRRTKP